MPMKLAFVKPTMGLQRQQPYRSRAMMEPLVFAILSGMTPPEHERHFFDERLEPVPVDERFDLVAISVETHTARRAYQLARAFSGNGSRVILGGFHPTLLPYEALLHADAIVVGEVEGVWSQILADVQAGTLQRVYQRPSRPALDGIIVDRTIFTGKPYLPLALVQYARGCHHHCDFCAIRQFYGSHIIRRPCVEVVQEIAGLHTRNVFFVDDNIVADRVAARELFQAIRPLRIRWVSQTGLDIVKDPDLLDLMAESGCIGLIIGLESLNNDNLAQMNKTWASSLGGYAQALRAIKQRGILVYGAFIFGYDYDTRDDIARTLEFAIEQQLFLATFNLLQPFPSTPLYHRLQAEGRLLFARWWMDPAYLWDKPAFQPLRVSAEELAEGCAQARRRFAGAGSILRRALDPHAHLRDPLRAMIYLAGNLISWNDIQRKRALSLGFHEDEPGIVTVGK